METAPSDQMVGGSVTVIMGGRESAVPSSPSSTVTMGLTMTMVKICLENKLLGSNIFEFVFQTVSSTARTQSVVQTLLIAQKSNIAHLCLNLVGQAT